MDALEERKWTLIALDNEGLPIGAVAINNGRDISMLRRAINSGAPFPAALAADAQPLRLTRIAQNPRPWQKLIENLFPRQ